MDVFAVIAFISLTIELLVLYVLNRKYKRAHQALRIIYKIQNEDSVFGRYYHKPEEKIARIKEEVIRYQTDTGTNFYWERGKE